MSDTIKHLLCVWCLASWAKQAGPWPQSDLPCCCRCGRPCEEGKFVPIYPTPELPCEYHEKPAEETQAA